MPISTTCEMRRGLRACKSKNCPTISPAVRLRVSPCVPVAQNAHAIGQPACVDRHTETWVLSGSRTHSIGLPDCVRASTLTVPSRVSVCSPFAVRGDRENSVSSVARRETGKSVIAWKDACAPPPSSGPVRRYSHSATCVPRNAGIPAWANVSRSSVVDRPGRDGRAEGSISLLYPLAVNKCQETGSTDRHVYAPPDVGTFTRKPALFQFWRKDTQ